MYKVIGTSDRFNIEFHFYEDGIFLTKEGEGHLAPAGRICGFDDPDGSIYRSHFGNSHKRLYIKHKY